MSSLVLRPSQDKAIDLCRQSIANGNKRVLLYGPTGFGKTEIAISLLRQSAEKNKRSAIIMDRVVLCQQTSVRLDKYGVDHGVIQAGSWRWRPQERIQVCSAQTLEKLDSIPLFDLLIIDEAHCQRQGTVAYIKNNNVPTIGLSASPFTKGLGSVYQDIITPVTTSELVGEGYLVPLRVFISKEIDMTDAKKVAGEWSQSEATQRGIKITGDIVSEWVKKTHQIFGKPEKTIVFCAGVAHGADLQDKFAQAGYNFISLSYKDDDEFKAEAIKEFSKEDSSIHGLIATDILTKGFDVPDVKIGISARPFTKSFSSHVQQMGRVMRAHPGKDFSLWLCIAKGSRVLTDEGLIPIDKVTKSHKIWDGDNFVNHGGAVCNGIQEVITYQGLTATAGHIVHTTEGWRTFGECANKQIRITQTGVGRNPIRIGADIRRTSFLAGRKAKEVYSCFLRMRVLWISKFDFFIKFAVWKNKRMQVMQSAGPNLSNVALQQSAGYESKVLFKIMRSISSLRRTGDRVQIFWGKARDYVDYGKSRFAEVFVCCGKIENTIRQSKPKWTLRTWEFALAIGGIESAKQAWESKCSKDAQIQDRLPGYFIFRQHIEAFLLGWHDSRTNSGKIQKAFNKTKREVWDILDAGQNNCFTCEGLLVHNCHSGNYLRFLGDWDDLYHNGVSELDDGKEKPKPEPTDKEKESAKCPKCSHLWPHRTDICPCCGYVKQKNNDVIVKSGELVEVGDTLKKEADYRRSFFHQLLTYQDSKPHYKPSWARVKYREKFGEWPRFAEGREPLTGGVSDWIKSRFIKFSNRKSK